LTASSGQLVRRTKMIGNTFIGDENGSGSPAIALSGTLDTEITDNTISFYNASGSGAIQLQSATNTLVARNFMADSGIYGATPLIEIQATTLNTICLDNIALANVTPGGITNAGGTNVFISGPSTNGGYLSLQGFQSTHVLPVSNSLGKLTIDGKLGQNFKWTNFGDTNIFYLTNGIDGKNVTVMVVNSNSTTSTYRFTNNNTLGPYWGGIGTNHPAVSTNVDIWTFHIVGTNWYGNGQTNYSLRALTP